DGAHPTGQTSRSADKIAHTDTDTSTTADVIQPERGAVFCSVKCGSRHQIVLIERQQIILNDLLSPAGKRRQHGRCLIYIPGIDRRHLTDIGSVAVYLVGVISVIIIKYFASVFCHADGCREWSNTAHTGGYVGHLIK